MSPSGRLIAGISDVGAVQIWTADGRKVSEFDLESGGWIREFSPDEKMLFTTTTQYGLESRELTIWLVRSGQRAYSFWGTAGIVDWNRRAMLIGTLSGELREFSLPLVGRNTSEIYRQFGERPFREYSDSELARYASGGGR